jgi:RNA polymerase sigma-70 factor (ECF subfamily)
LRKKYEQADDTTLIKGCLRGHESAQKALYERFSSCMMGVCYRYVRNRSDAEDVLQEGFIKVFQNMEQFRLEGSLEGWIRKIMVRTAINFLNKNKDLWLDIEPERMGEIPAVDTNEDDFHKNEMMRMLNSMPDGYKAIINLFAIEGYSHKEIGKMLGIAESTSRSQYARAKEMLIKISGRQAGVHTLDK